MSREVNGNDLGLCTSICMTDPTMVENSLEKLKEMKVGVWNLKLC